MSRKLSRRLLPQSPQSLISELAPVCKFSSRYLRPFSQSARRRDDDLSKLLSEAAPVSSPSAATPRPDRFSYGQTTSSASLHPKAAPGAMANLAGMIDRNNMDRNMARRNIPYNPLSASLFDKPDTRAPHQLHIYASRHNCHITLWGPPNSVRMSKKKDKESFKGGAILSLSAGQIGFRHSGRKHYDSAFQLASYAFARMAEAGVSQDIQKLELYLRGFGAGREAITKALLGAEGKLLRNKVIKVADTTRLKFGGTRSPKPRRLG